MSDIEFTSDLTCPDCGHVKSEQMPTDSCLFFYECESCGVLMKPQAGDCCVFCSYGTLPCPPIQEARQKGLDSTDVGCS